MSTLLNARHLVLDLLYASKNHQISVKRMLCAAKLLGITENAVRVAITRLAQDQFIYCVSRGIYAMTYKKFNNDVGLLKNPELYLSTEWDGSYILVSTGSLGRTDRSALAKREKALAYYGFRAIDSALYIRPNNLSPSILELKQLMVAFGLEASAQFFKVSQVESVRKVRELWNTAELIAGYHQASQSIQHWIAQAETLDLAAAAHSSFFVGKATILTLRHDPLLPAEWIDIQARSSLERDVRDMYQRGRQVWEQYFQMQNI